MKTDSDVPPTSKKLLSGPASPLLQDRRQAAATVFSLRESSAAEASRAALRWSSRSRRRSTLPLAVNGKDPSPTRTEGIMYAASRSLSSLVELPSVD